MKISARSGRSLAVLAGAALLTASALAGGQAGAVTRSAGHPAPRAAALGFLVHRGIDLAELRSHGIRASALPGDARSVPEPGTSSELLGLACTSSTDCWAVGTYKPGTDASLNEVLHWNGSTWKKVSAPSPAGSASGNINILFGVRCLAASDCWAVGVVQPTGGADLDQTLHWNGTKWSVVPTPTPGGSLSGDVNELFEVVCTSTANCWAVGQYGTQVGGATEVLNQVLRWNGRKWALTSVPNPAGTTVNDVNRLDSVRCTSSANCLAVGTYGTLNSPLTLVNQALRWDGTTWSQVSVPSPGGTTGNGTFNELDGLGCSSPANCWAVGSDGIFPGTLFNQALHWNGTAWTQVTTPEPSGTGAGASQELLFVTCKSGTDCWAVGDYQSGSGTSAFAQNQALHWDGGTWSLVDTPELGGAAPGDTNNLRAVRCTSTTNCWAVGLARTSGGNFFGVALRWNGTIWSPG